MIRFSRDKRFGRAVKFAEFQQIALALADAVRAQKPEVQVEIRTCENGMTYWAAQVTTVGDPDLNALLEMRPRYKLEEFSEEVWLLAYRVQMDIYDPSSKERFMINLCVDREKEPHRIMFWYQNVSEAVEALLQPYRKSSWLCSISVR